MAQPSSSESLTEPLKNSSESSDPLIELVVVRDDDAKGIYELRPIEQERGPKRLDVTGAVNVATSRRSRSERFIPMCSWQRRGLEVFMGCSGSSA